jgi:hypothetical protein
MDILRPFIQPWLVSKELYSRKFIAIGGQKLEIYSPKNLPKYLNKDSEWNKIIDRISSKSYDVEMLESCRQTIRAPIIIDKFGFSLQDHQLRTAWKNSLHGRQNTLIESNALRIEILTPILLMATSSKRNSFYNITENDVWNLQAQIEKYSELINIKDRIEVVEHMKQLAWQLLDLYRGKYSF